ncbi:MAG: hypothetical protein COA40_07790 [Aequorivita sp.]|nr:MAG: hypothetical protein COA40_07790 [Aequorivita sp.]
MHTATPKNLSVQTLLFLIFFCPLVGFSQFYQLGETLDGVQAGDYSGFSVSLNNEGNRVVVGEVQDQNVITHLGQIKVYEYTNDSWQQLGQTIVGDPEGRFFGYAVSMNGNGNVLAIGNPMLDNGFVRIYTLENNTWVQLGNDLIGQSFGDMFGQAIALDHTGNKIVIGSPGNNGNGNNGGSTQVFEYTNDSWVQVGNNINGEFGLDYSGEAVSINFHGNIIAVGAKTNSGGGNNAGHVRVYQFDGTDWVQQGEDINGEAAGDLSGRSVSLNASGTIVAIGAADNDANGISSGQVRIFEFQDNEWLQLGADIDGENEFDNLGRAVSINGNGHVVAVASSFAGNGGLVKLYQYLNGEWLQVDETLLGANYGDCFGYSVSLNSRGNVLAAGAPFYDGNGEDAGQVKVYGTSSILSIQEQHINNFSLYPNPTDGKASLYMADDSEIFAITIADIAGNQIMKIDAKKSKEIDLTNFAQGMYLLQIETNLGVFTSKLIKY